MIGEKHGKLEKLELTIAKDRYFLFTLLSVFSTFVILFNALIIRFFLIGVVMFAIYLLVNAVFIGQVFYDNEQSLFRLAIGCFWVLAFIAIVSAGLILINRFSAFFNIVGLGGITIALSIVNRIARLRSQKPAVGQEQG